MPCIVFDLMLILLVTRKYRASFLVTISLRIIMWNTFFFVFVFFFVLTQVSEIRLLGGDVCVSFVQVSSLAKIC